MRFICAERTTDFNELTRPYLPFATHSRFHSECGAMNIYYCNAHQNFLALSTKPKQKYLLFIFNGKHSRSSKNKMKSVTRSKLCKPNVSIKNDVNFNFSCFESRRPKATVDETHHTYASQQIIIVLNSIIS